MKAPKRILAPTLGSMWWDGMNVLKLKPLSCLLALLALGLFFVLATFSSSSGRMWLWLSQQPYSGNIAGMMIRCNSGTDGVNKDLRISVKYDGPLTVTDTQSERMERVQKICASNPTGVSSIYDNPHRLKNILVDEHLKAMFCYIPKAGSTSWKYVLLNASKRSHEPQDARDFRDVHTAVYKSLRRLDSYSPSDIKFKLDNYFKFMIVRHPLERLGSAYYDRFYLIEQGNAEHGNAGTYRDYKDEIVKTTKNTDLSSSCIGFDRFVKYLTLAEPAKFDEHWSLYDEVCNPCGIHYDYIGKVETMDIDSPNILRLLNISGVQLPKYHVHKQTNSSYLHYYNKVKPQDLQSLLKIYSKDFELFGYSLPTAKDINAVKT